MWNAVFHVIALILGRPVVARIFKKIESVDSLDLLDEEQKARLRHRIDRLRRKRTIAGYSTVALCVICVVVGLKYFIAMTELPPINPILDQRAPFRRLVAPALGLVLGGLLSIIVGRIVVRREMGESSAMFWRYLATQTNSDARKSQKWSFIVGVPIAAFMAALLINPGLIVDERGILSSSGFLRSALHHYDEISTIILYARVDAPAGIVVRDNVCIRLKNGNEVRLDYEGRPQELPNVRDVADYISGKSGIPVTTADIRPRS